MQPIQVPVKSMNRILLVDDDALNSEQMSVWFRQEGYEADIIEDIDKCPDEKMVGYQSVLMDLTPRHSNGYDALGKLKERGFAGSVFIVSGLHRNLIDHAVRYGKKIGLNVSDGFQKPLLYDEVIKIAEKVSSLSTIFPDEIYQCALTLEELEHCIESEKIDFLIQPIMSVRTGEVAGGELLARARIKNRHVSIAPAVYNLPIRSLERLTRLAFQNAAQLVGTPYFQNGNLRLSLNVPSSLIETQFFARIMFEYQLDTFANSLTIELSEADSIADERKALSNMMRAIGTGYRFSLDDFGRGTSNLDRLLFFPCAEIKLDRFCVDGCATDDRKRAICASVSQLGRSLGMIITAEGVENEDDLNLLKHLGVDFFQGYIRYRPLERSDFLKLAFIKSYAAHSNGKG